jgi:hypothetical protein
MRDELPGPRDEAGSVERSPTMRMPRWVKVFGLVVAVLLVAMAVAMLVSGARHGPGRHLSSAPQVPPALVHAGARAGAGR